MPEDVKQPVVDETKAQPAAGAAGNDAPDNGDELDKLLSQFDQEAPKPAAPSKPEQTQPTATDPNIQKLVSDEVSRGLETERRRSEIQNLYDKAVEHLQKEINLPLKAVRGWVEEIGKDDPRIAKAYFGAKTDAERAKVLTGLVKQFKKELSENSIDENATEDKAVVAAAVRGASTRAPEGKPPDYAKMSDSDFQKEKEKLFGT